MSFNPDLNKQAQEVIFFRKLRKPFHAKIFYNNAPVVFADCQKHLGMYLNKGLSFKEKIPKAMKGIGFNQKLSKNLSRHCLITTCKSFFETSSRI